MKKLRSIFNGPFLIMYAVALVIWENVITYLSFFTAFDAAYTAQTAENAIKAIEAARLLPDAAARRAESKRLRKLLRITGKKCCNNFLTLLAYIEKSFPEAEWEAVRQTAGYEGYKKAAKGNITQLIALNTAALTFISNNAEVLQAGGMPAGFISDITKDANAFGKLNGSYTAAIQLQREETNAKIVANNIIYTTLVNMLKDAKIIFINDPAMLAFFTYKTIAVRFKKEGKTGYRFILKEQGSEAPVQNAPIFIQPGNIAIATNKKGVALIELQKDIFYSYTIMVPGFNSISKVNQPTISGVMSRQNIILTKIPVALAV